MLEHFCFLQDDRFCFILINDFKLIKGVIFLYSTIYCLDSGVHAGVEYVIYEFIFN